MDNSGNYWTTEQETTIWIMTAEILGDPNIKIIAQNGIFDLMYLLRTLNIKSDNFYFDTMLAQHLVYTELPKGLDFLTSVYTYFPYHKDGGKESHFAMIKDWPSYWKYNARDSAYLFPIMDQLKIELEDFESSDAMQYQMELHKPIMEMEYNGVLTDKEGIEEYRKELAVKIEKLQSDLDALTGKELNINSSQQLVSYFYGELKLKPYINRKTKNASCDTVALHRIAKKDHKASDVAKIIINMRKYGKLISTYFKTDNIDEKDDKLRCSYKIAGTVSGRLASSKTYFEHSSGEKLGCLLPTAEVLTPNGWIQFQYFKEGTEALQWEAETNEFSWCIPKLYKAKSPGHVFHLNTEQTKGIFTPFHRVPSYGHRKTNMLTLSANETSKMADRLIPLGANLSGDLDLPRIFLRILVMVQADGTIENSNVRFSFKKKKKIDRFIYLMNQIGFKYSEQKAREGYRRFSIKPEDSKLIKQFFDKTKTFGNWIYQLPLDAKEAFIDEIKYWDAHIRGNSFIYYTTNKINADLISTLVHLTNKSCNVRIDYDNNNNIIPLKYKL